MSNIRVTYSGLISFAITLVTVFTGLGFMIIVTRILSTQEYGTWGLINSLLIYGVVFTAIPVFWLVRETARELKTEKTGLLSSVIWSLVGILVYFLAVIVLAPQTNVDMTILLFAVILVPVSYFHKIISAINLGWKPQLSSYGILVTEVLKVPLALLFVYYMDFGVIGVIISMFISLLSSVVFQIIVARKRLQGYFKFSIIKNWFRLSWVSMYPKIAYVMYNSDVIIFSIILGSVEMIAYYVAALVLANLVGLAGGISGSVSPKLLGGGKRTIPIKNFTYAIYFAVPLLSLSIIFAEAGLTILNPVYKTAALVVVFLSFRMLFRSLAGTLGGYLGGIETVDIKENATTKDYLKSIFITIPTFRIIQYSVYLLVFSIVIISMESIISKIELVIMWSAISMTIHLPLLIYLIIKVRNAFETNFELTSILKYIIVGFCAFGFVSFLTDKFLVVSEKLIEIIPNVLLFVLFGVGLYILITYIIDSKTRNLLNGIVKEIDRRKR